MIVAGLDEVGYGCLAGIVVSVVAVFRDEDLPKMPKGVRDSKKVSEPEREGLYPRIINTALDIGVGHAWPWEIDDLGAFESLQMSYRRALADVRCKFDTLIVDGQHEVRRWRGKQVVEPKADVKYIQVSAASIVAKVFRDRAMVQLGAYYPAYAWGENKGYGTKVHEAAIHKHGLVLGPRDPLTYIHRRRYCQKVLLRGD